MLAVFAQYGRTMLAVQHFESALASLVLAVEVDPHKSVTLSKKYLSREIKKLIHAYRRASARELQKKLDDRLEPELLGEIENAIRWRNRLAHSYLRDNLRMTAQEAFCSGVLSEMVALTTGLEKLSRRLNQELEELVSEWPNDPIPEKLRESTQQVARSIMLGRDLPAAG